MRIMYSKSGCQTCKFVACSTRRFSQSTRLTSHCRVRKVKCDEAYPACHRCQSTGRACDGYNATRGRSLHGTVPRQPHLTLAAAISTEEKSHFEWFELRTLRKLPGTCQGEFWSKLIPQASLSDPAVLHASLALGSLHYEIVEHPASLALDSSSPRNLRTQKLSQLSICNYLKAMQHLRLQLALAGDNEPKLRDRDCIQALLIACILFISIECMRGHLVAAHTHIRSGLTIISNTLCVVDDWIAEAFARIELQFNLWTIWHMDKTCASIEASWTLESYIPSKLRNFNTIKEAWSYLGKAMNKSLHLTQASRNCKINRASSLDPRLLLEYQKHLLKDLKRWISLYEASLKKDRLLELSKFPAAEREKVLLILSVYHTMATIMAELCLCWDDEMAYDTQVYRFTDMLHRLQDTYSYGEASPNLRHFIMDVGCLAPLQYLAVKCRDHAIRWQAIEMLEAVHHREGIWDAQMTALISRKIVELEEGDFFAKELSNTADSQLPFLRRVSLLNIVLLGNPTESITLHLRRPTDGKHVANYVVKIDVSIP